MVEHDWLFCLSLLNKSNFVNNKTFLVHPNHWLIVNVLYGMNTHLHLAKEIFCLLVKMKNKVS